MAEASPTRIVLTLGTAQTLSWASTYYLPAILAAPIAAELGISVATVFAAFSVGLVISAFLGTHAGRAIDRFGGRPILIGTNAVFALGLTGLGLAEGPIGLFAAWIVLGAGMAAGLYEAAFATVVRLHGHSARNIITGITLLAGLVLGDDLWLKAAMPIPGDFYRQLAKVALESFLALAVAGVASRIGNRVVLGVAQMFCHLGLQGAFHQFLGELLEQAVLTDKVFRFLVVSQQAVDQFVRDGHLIANPLKCSSFLPIDHLHKSSYTPFDFPRQRH